MRISDWSSDVCSSDLPAWRPMPRGGRLPVSAGIADGGSSRPWSEIQLQIAGPMPVGTIGARIDGVDRACRPEDRKSVVSGKSVSGRVDLGGRSIIKKKNTKERRDNI